MILQRLCLLVAGSFVLHSSLPAAEDDLSIPSEAYYPPREGSEQQALAQMRATVPELQGAHTRGKPDDYLRVILRAFRGGTQDLAEFFRWSHGPTGSAAGGEMTNDVTLRLLYHWGDQRFAAVLARQSLKVRRGVGRHFWLQQPGQGEAFRRGFPATAEAALLLPPP